MKKLAFLVAITFASFQAQAQLQPMPAGGAAGSTTPVIEAPLPGGYVAPGGARPPAAAMSNNQITAAQSDTRIAATQMSIKGAEFDFLMTAAIDAADVAQVRELLRSGVKVGFPASDKYCTRWHSHLPAACEKAFIARAVSSPLLSSKSRKPLLISAAGGAPSERSIAQAKASIAKDREVRQIIADLVANTPAVDKAYFPAYALMAQREGDYDLAWWFYQEWKAALPEIAKAPESALPNRIELATRAAAVTGVIIARSWPGRWGFHADSVGHWQDDAHPAALLLLDMITRVSRQSHAFTMAELRGEQHLTVYYASRGQYFVSDQPAQLKMLQRLLAEKPDFNFQDTVGNSPLHVLARGRSGGDRRRFGPVIRALLEAGANPNLLNKAGETPMSIVVQAAAIPNESVSLTDDRSWTLKAFTDKSFEIELPERTGRGLRDAKPVFFTPGLGL